MALLVAGLRSQEMFSAAPEAISPAIERAAAVAAAAVVCSDPAETRLLSRLQRLMEEERVYRVEGLTIGALASRAGAPEYALRRLSTAASAIELQRIPERLAAGGRRSGADRSRRNGRCRSPRSP
jgi:hypothetical protein